MSSAGAPSPFVYFKCKKLLRSSINKPHFSGEPLEHTHRQSDLKRSISFSSDPVTFTNTSTESLSEKCEMLHTFFDRLVSSIRLLRLKRSMSTFTNISRQVEILTDRSFGYGDLGRMKFILPEVIEVKKILVRDDRTCCMKPDLHVSLNFGIVHDDEKMSYESVYLLLSNLFRSRLLSFCKSNPEVDEVPMEQLPDPFNKSNRCSYSDAIRKANVGSVHDMASSVHEQQPMAASHMPQSFKRRFSKQVLIQSVEPVKQESRVSRRETQVDHSFSDVACVSNVLSPVKQYANVSETPMKGFDLGENDLSSIDGTLVNVVSTPFSDTKVRCFITADKDSVMSPSKLTRRASCKRSITFDAPVKNRTPPVKRVSTDDYLSDILSDDVLASIKETELKALEEKNPEISQAKWRKQMLAGLPKLFDTLLFFFQSIKQTVIAKDELMNIITSSQIEIVDRREADEQLRLLLELAPEWIYEKIASSGDLLVCVNKISSPESIRTRLSKAD